MKLGLPPDGPGAGMSRWANLDGPLHYLDFGGPAGGPVIVCVHGLGGSAVNWMSVAPLLAGECRIVAPDLPGHGLTESRGRGADVLANARLLHRFVGEVAGRPAILMGNSMGGMISLLEAGESPDAVAGLILLDPALPFVPARPDPRVAMLFAAMLLPGAGRAMIRRRRRSPQSYVQGILRLVCVDPARVPRPVIDRHIEVATQRARFAGAEEDFAAALRSVIATIGYPGRRAYRRRIRSLRLPVLLIHGSGDRLVPAAAARAAARANPAWSLAELPGVGHVPQLEAPRQTAGIVMGWLRGAGQRAADAARRAELG